MGEVVLIAVAACYRKLEDRRIFHRIARWVDVAAHLVVGCSRNAQLDKHPHRGVNGLESLLAILQPATESTPEPSIQDPAATYVLCMRCIHLGKS